MSSIHAERSGTSPRTKGKSSAADEWGHSIIIITTIVITMIMMIIVTIIIIIIVLRIILLLLLIIILSWLRTSRVDTNGVAAKVMIVDRLGEKVRPGTFGKINVG